MSLFDDVTAPSNQSCGSCEAASARCWCVECNEALCDECVSAHRRVSLTRAHKILNQPRSGISLAAIAPPPTKFCRLHPSEALKLFCFTCNQLTCRDCQLTSHMKHRYQFISAELLEGVKKGLEDRIQPFRAHGEKAQQSLTDMETRLTDIAESRSILASQLQQTYFKLLTHLQERMNSFLEQAKMVSERETEMLQKRISVLKQLQQKHRTLFETAEKAQKSSDIVALQSYAAQIEAQLKVCDFQDCSPHTMSSLKVVCETQAMTHVMNFGNLDVTWVPFSVAPTTPKPRVSPATASTSTSSSSSSSRTSTPSSDTNSPAPNVPVNNVPVASASVPHTPSSNRLTPPPPSYNQSTAPIPTTSSAKNSNKKVVPSTSAVDSKPEQKILPMGRVQPFSNSVNVQQVSSMSASLNSINRAIAYLVTNNNTAHQVPCLPLKETPSSQSVFNAHKETQRLWSQHLKLKSSSAPPATPRYNILVPMPTKQNQTKIAPKATTSPQPLNDRGSTAAAISSTHLSSALSLISSVGSDQILVPMQNHQVLSAAAQKESSSREPLYDVTKDADGNFTISHKNQIISSVSPEQILVPIQNQKVLSASAQKEKSSLQPPYDVTKAADAHITVRNRNQIISSMLTSEEMPTTSAKEGTSTQPLSDKSSTTAIATVYSSPIPSVRSENDKLVPLPSQTVPKSPEESPNSKPVEDQSSTGIKTRKYDEFIGACALFLKQQPAQQNPVVKAVADSACDRGEKPVESTRWQEPLEGEPTSTMSEESETGSEASFLEKNSEKNCEPISKHKQLVDLEASSKPSDSDDSNQGWKSSTSEDNKLDLKLSESEESNLEWKGPDGTEVSSRKDAGESSCLIGPSECTRSQWQQTTAQDSEPELKPCKSLDSKLEFKPSEPQDHESILKQSEVSARDAGEPSILIGQPECSRSHSELMADPNTNPKPAFTESVPEVSKLVLNPLEPKDSKLSWNSSTFEDASNLEFKPSTSEVSARHTGEPSDLIGQPACSNSQCEPIAPPSLTPNNNPEPALEPSFPEVGQIELEKSEHQDIELDPEMSDSDSDEPSFLIGQQDCSGSQWQPTVSMFRLPVKRPKPGRPLPGFRLFPGVDEDHIEIEMISDCSESDDDDDDDDDDDVTDDVTDDITEEPSSPESPVTLQLVSCSACGSANGSIICSTCGRGYHRECHVPPVGPDIWSEWNCSLCRDLTDDSDGTEKPSSLCLNLLEQRRCESLLLYLKVEGCTHLSESGPVWSGLKRLSTRICVFKTPGKLVLHLWSLLKDASQDDGGELLKLRQRLHSKVKDIFGPDFHQSLVEPATPTRPEGPGEREGETGGAREREGEMGEVGEREGEMGEVGEREGEMGEVGEREGETEGVWEREGEMGEVGERLGETEGVGEREGEMGGAREREGETEGVGEIEGETEGVWEREGEMGEVGERLGETEGVGEREGETEGVGEREGETGGVGEIEGETEGVWEREGETEEVGEREGETEGVWEREGEMGGAREREGETEGVEEREGETGEVGEQGSRVPEESKHKEIRKRLREFLDLNGTPLSKRIRVASDYDVFRTVSMDL